MEARDSGLQAAHELENSEWRQLSDKVDNQLHTLITFNLHHVIRHASRIDPIYWHAALVGFGEGACFEIADTGPSLQPGHEFTAFDPYVRGNEKTAGLVATVKRLVEAHAGRGGVRRNDDNGAACWLELPIAG